MTRRTGRHKTRSSGECSAKARPLVARHAGFTMIELLVCIAIMVVLVAIATPQVLYAIRMSRIRSDAGSLSALIQQARTAAEQHNATIGFYAANVGTRSLPGAFISCSSTHPTTNCPDGTTWNNGDPSLPYGSGVTNGTAANAPAGLNPGFTPQTAGTTLYVTSLGTVSNVATGAYTWKGFVFYLTDNSNDWAAVSVSPQGRSKVWVYTGGWH